MLTPEEATEAQAMHASGWTITMIARHLNHDRKTIRSYLTGQRVPGVRRSGPDALERFTDYCQRRFTDEPRLPAATLFEELAELGYQGAYSTFTRALRHRCLRPPSRHAPSGADANQVNTSNTPASKQAIPVEHASKPQPVPSPNHTVKPDDTLSVLLQMLADLNRRTASTSCEP